MISDKRLQEIESRWPKVSSVVHIGYINLLISEVRKLKEESAAWEKASLVQLLRENEALKERNKELSQELLDWKS